MTFKEEMATRCFLQGNYDNGINLPGVLPELMQVPFQVGNKVCWIIMSNESHFEDYSESCTLYGVTEEGFWAAVYDSHCSCNGWEAQESDITYYDKLTQLLDADREALVILEYKEQILEHYPFIEVEDVTKYLLNKIKAQNNQLKNIETAISQARYELMKVFGDNKEECFKNIPHMASLLGVK